MPAATLARAETSNEDQKRHDDLPGAGGAKPALGFRGALVSEGLVPPPTVLDPQPIETAEQWEERDATLLLVLAWLMACYARKSATVEMEGGYLKRAE